MTCLAPSSPALVDPAAPPPFPIAMPVLRDLALGAWEEVWGTRIGSATAGVPLAEWKPTASLVGNLFEGLLARALAAAFPGDWRQGSAKGEKDLLCLTDPLASIEVKTSGQGGIAIYGNRSYAQPGPDGLPDPAKCGYYLTANFVGTRLYLLRFGWLDHRDWIPQASATGQAATLRASAYRDHLRPLLGDYTLEAPLGVMPGIGAQQVQAAAGMGVHALRDLLRYTGRDATLLALQHRVQQSPEDPTWWASPKERSSEALAGGPPLELFG